jgi:hypothetical protein
VTPGPGELAGVETAAVSSQPEGGISDAEYLELRRRIQDVIYKLIPASSTILVVSKGDEQLVRLEDREGWHFPRTSAGQYGGYHPADAVAAISHLEELRASGADYFLLPSPYFWWLDHYPELAEHLQSRYRLVTDRPDSCLIYHLNEPPLGTPTLATRPASTLERPNAPEEAASPIQLVPPMRDLLASILERGAGVLIVSDGNDEWLNIDHKAWHFPQDASGRHVPISRSRGLSMLAQLDALRDRGAHYLVIPSTSFWMVERSEELLRYLSRSKLIALRERICAVFELRDVSGGTPRTRPHDALPEPADDRTRQDARPGGLGRILRSAIQSEDEDDG